MESEKILLSGQYTAGEEEREEQGVHSPISFSSPPLSSLTVSLLHLPHPALPSFLSTWGRVVIRVCDRFAREGRIRSCSATSTRSKDLSRTTSSYYILVIQRNKERRRMEQYKGRRRERRKQTLAIGLAERSNEEVLFSVTISVMLEIEVDNCTTKLIFSLLLGNLSVSPYFTLDQHTVVCTCGAATT